MIKLSEWFKPKHKEDVEKIVKVQDEALKVRQSLQQIGQACFADPKFQKYKETYEVLERITFDQVRAYQNADPIQYAMVISGMLRELNTFETLIGDVTSDKNKKMPAPKVEDTNAV